MQTWTSRYIPPTFSSWQGRSDAPNLSFVYQQVKLLDLRESHFAEKPSIALLGFSCDEGIRRNLGRLGAAAGPLHLREVLAKFAMHRKDIILYDSGDIICEDNNLEMSQLALSEAVSLLLQQHITPIIIGGGHELAWGHYQGLSKHFSPDSFSIVNFDAHVDMRPLLPENKGSSGTPFLQIAKDYDRRKQKMQYHCLGIQRSGNTETLLNTAGQYHSQLIYAEDFYYANKIVKQQIELLLAAQKFIYASLCLDVFASAYAPGVSAPQILGLMPHQVLPLLRQLAQSGKVLSYDIAELSPPNDIDSRTAKLAASLVYEIIHSHQVNNE